MGPYLVRHGVAANRRDWQGNDADRPLTQEGKKEMERVAAGIAKLGLELDAILTSPYRRASETAEIVWPAGPLGTRVLEIVDDAPLVRWFVLRQTRLNRQVLKGKRLAGEMSRDDVCVTANGKALTFLEVEAELGQEGTSEDPTHIVASLENERHLHPEGRSKFERAVEFLGAAPHRRRRRAWHNTFSSATPTASPSPSPPERPGIRADDSMAEAERKTLRLHLQRMVRVEDGERAGEGLEALHAVHVATRRMRASLQAFDGHVHRKTVKPFAQTLRRAGRTLGAVRDLDVFREKAERYLENLPAERRSKLDPLLSVRREEYARVREEMIGDWTAMPPNASRQFSRSDWPSPARSKKRGRTIKSRRPHACRMSFLSSFLRAGRAYEHTMIRCDRWKCRSSAATNCAARPRACDARSSSLKRCHGRKQGHFSNRLSDCKTIWAIKTRW